MLAVANRLRRWASPTWQDLRGQDLIEYSLMTGLVAVVATAVFPITIAPALTSIFAKIISIIDTMPTG